MTPKAAIFCSYGIGDGLLFLLLSHNLRINGFQVDTYHDLLSEVNNWFPSVSIKKYPPAHIEQLIIEQLLKNYDLIIINSDHLPINKKIKEIAFTNYASKSYELHPSTCKNKKSFIGSYQFDIGKTLLDNLLIFAKERLGLKKLEKRNAIEPLEGLKYRANKRVVIHPLSNDVSRNWPIDKFIKTSEFIQKLGYETFFIMSPKEKETFVYKQSAISFDKLSDIFAFIYESAFFLGNDSGMGHLASCLKVPTLTIASSKRKKLFWRPDYFLAKTLAPLAGLPNFKILRLRKKLWKYFISGRRVCRAFVDLEKAYESGSF